ncbi:hypothetical protein AC1031_014060 [Aphanomyces cochlioides]|nr:hypothetical protein AC1031_014060 [Aphanomyces cochlioides]
MRSFALALAATAGVHAASCPYQALPSNINLIEVWDTQYSTCKTDRCVVDRNCNTADASGKVYDQNNFQAFGSFLSAAKTISAWIWNFSGTTVDMSMVAYPTFVSYLSFSNADTMSLPTPLNLHASTLLFKDISSFSGPKTWNSELTDLYVYSIPKLNVVVQDIGKRQFEIFAGDSEHIDGFACPTQFSVEFVGIEKSSNVPAAFKYQPKCVYRIVNFELAQPPSIVPAKQRQADPNCQRDI